ncbi:MAG: glycosyltransferase [Bryobacteraceae bacterium]
MLPEADIFTLFYEPEAVSQVIRSHRVTASFLNPLRRFHRQLLPLMPFALGRFDLRDYDRAFVLPGEEDFGITPVEALASGKPVIALGRDGVLDSVSDGVSGVFFSEPSERSLEGAVRRFEAMEHSSVPLLQQHAARFSESVFIEAMTALIQADGR